MSSFSAPFSCNLISLRVSLFLLSTQWAVVVFSLQEPPRLLLEFQRKICSQVNATLSPQTTYPELGTLH